MICFKEKTPVVSISCLTYNHAPYIRECMEGFLKQETTFPFEVLIHDDCSTDGTIDIINEYASKRPDIIFPLFEKENQYSSGKPSGTAVWNYPRARGKYLALCEGDDYWTDPYKLQKQVIFLESHPEVGMCYTRVERLNQSSGKIIDEWGGSAETFEDLIKKNTVPTLSTCFRLSLYKEYIDEVEPSRKNWLMGDYPMWLYFALKNKIKFIDDVSGCYRILKESASHSKSITKRYTFDKSFKSIAEYFLKTNSDIVKAEVIEKFLEKKHSLLLTMANVVKDEEELNEAKTYLKNHSKSFRLKILTLPNWLIRYPIMLKYYLHGWKM